MTMTPATTATARAHIAEAATAPIDTELLARALQPFGESTMLPSAAYTDPAVLAWERRHFIAGSWACVGRIDDLAVDDSGRALSQRAT